MYWEPYVVCVLGTLCDMEGMAGFEDLAINALKMCLTMQEVSKHCHSTSFFDSAASGAWDCGSLSF